MSRRVVVIALLMGLVAGVPVLYLYWAWPTVPELVPTHLGRWPTTPQVASGCGI